MKWRLRSSVRSSSVAKPRACLNGEGHFRTRVVALGCFGHGAVVAVGWLCGMGRTSVLFADHCSQSRTHPSKKPFPQGPFRATHLSGHDKTTDTMIRPTQILRSGEPNWRVGK